MRRIDTVTGQWLVLLLLSTRATTGFLSLNHVERITTHVCAHTRSSANGTILYVQNSSGVNLNGVLIRDPVPSELVPVLNVLQKHNRGNASKPSSFFDSLHDLNTTKAPLVTKPYNQNPKNSQEIIRTIQLRSFHREMEQAAKEASTILASSHTGRKRSSSYRPVLLATLYATIAVTTTSISNQPPPWTIGQHLLPPTPTFFQTMTTTTWIAVTLPLVLRFTLRLAIAVHQAVQLTQLRQLIPIQVNALARGLYQALDDVIRRIPSDAALARTTGTWPPRPHPMLVNRNNGPANGGVSMEASHQVEEILLAAKCLALLGYSTQPMSADAKTLLQSAMVKRLLHEKESANADPIAALLERIRQVVCRLKCRDFTSQYSWEERIFALETHLTLLTALQEDQLPRKNDNNGNDMEQPGLPLAWQPPSTKRRFTVLKRRIGRRIKPLLQPSVWSMGIFPWMMTAHPIQPLAVVWSMTMLAFFTVVAESMIDQLQQDGGPLGSIMPLQNPAKNWGRRILDTVKQQMISPTTPTASSLPPFNEVNTATETPPSTSAGETASY